MKRPFLLLVSLVIFINTQAWELVGPADIVATNICFAGELYNGIMICSDDGMYLNDENSLQWDHYSEAGLPVIEGIFLETETILVVMGNGSYSDGIYIFNTNTGQFTLVEYCLEPSFLRFDPTTSKYYVGHTGGLLVSEEGTNWSEVGFFSGKQCLEIAFDYVNLVVTVNQLPPNVYRSNNSGDTWQSSSSFSPLFRMASYYGPNFFGMCPLNTALSGFYSTTDGGNTWDMEFASNNISDVSYDQNGFLLVTWQNSGSGYEGLAIYEPGTGTSGLTFLNDGLPSTNILRVKQREGIDVHFAYACTDMGVYSILFLGVEENLNQDFTISPNPTVGKDQIKIRFDKVKYINSIQVLSLEGQIVKDKTCNNSIDQLELKLDGLKPGIYLININSGQNTQTGKIILK